MKRLKNVFTTFIGLVIIASTLYFVCMGKTTFAEASGFVTIGIALLFSNDEQFSKNFLPFLYKNKGQKAEDEVPINPNDFK